MHRVLLLDLVVPPDRGLGAQLARCGFCVEFCRDLDALITVLDRASPCLAVVRTDGATDIEPALRLLGGVPAAVVCTQPDEELVVGCLEAGAQAVLSGLVSRRELAARVGVLHRRRHGEQATETGPGAGSLHLGDLEIDPDARRVSRAGSPISLTPLEFRLLLALARRGGRVVSHEQLRAEVWGPQDVGSADDLRTYVRYLRRKLHDDPARPRLLLSQRAVGYKLAAATPDGRQAGA